MLIKTQTPVSVISSLPRHTGGSPQPRPPPERNPGSGTQLAHGARGCADSDVRALERKRHRMSEKQTQIISIDQARLRKQQTQTEDQQQENRYRARILGMEKVELLEEMVRFQEERSRVGKLTPQMMRQGRHLFQALETSAETKELRILAGSYRRHLELELEESRKQKI